MSGELFDALTRRDKMIGRGGEREVYALSDDYVLKAIRKNRENLSGAQNKLELRVHQERPDHLRYLLCPIVAHFYRGEVPIIIMERRDTFTEGEKRELRRAWKGPPDLLGVYYKVKGLEGYDEFRRDAIELCERFDLSVRECLNIVSNWGKLPDGRIQYIDYGGKASGREKARGR